MGLVLLSVRKMFLVAGNWSQAQIGREGNVPAHRAKRCRGRSGFRCNKIKAPAQPLSVSASFLALFPIQYINSWSSSTYNSFLWKRGHQLWWEQGSFPEFSHKILFISLWSALSHVPILECFLIIRTTLYIQGLGRTLYWLMHTSWLKVIKKTINMKET